MHPDARFHVDNALPLFSGLQGFGALALALIVLAARCRSRLPSNPVTLPNLEPDEPQILKMAKSLGAINEKVRKIL